MYKAIFIDIDGTLRNSNKKITKNTINAIKNTVQKGILVVLCSGRPKKYTEEISREVGASSYIITSNGGVIYDYNKNEIKLGNYIAPISLNKNDFNNSEQYKIVLKFYSKNKRHCVKLPSSVSDFGSYPLIHKIKVRTLIVKNKATIAVIANNIRNLHFDIGSFSSIHPLE